MNFTQNQKSEISQKVIILAICLSNIYYNSTKFPLTLRLINPSHPLLGNDGVCDPLPSLLDIVMFHVNACIIVHFGTQEEFGSRVGRLSLSVPFFADVTRRESAQRVFMKGLLYLRLIDKYMDKSKDRQLDNHRVRYSNETDKDKHRG